MLQEQQELFQPFPWTMARKRLCFFILNLFRNHNIHSLKCFQTVHTTFDWYVLNTSFSILIRLRLVSVAEKYMLSFMLFHEHLSVN